MKYWKICETESTTQYLLFDKNMFRKSTFKKEVDIDRAIADKEIHKIKGHRYKDFDAINFIDTDSTIEFEYVDDNKDEIEIELDSKKYLEIKEFLNQNLKGTEIKNYSIWKQAYPIGIGVVLFGGVTALVYNMALSLASGEEISARSGRHRFFKKILIWIADLLGTTGSLVVGGLLTAFFLFLLFKTIFKPKKGIVQVIGHLTELIE